MPASKYDFDIEQGSSFKIIFTYKNSQGTPIDITDWCARLTWTTNKNVTQTFISTNTDDTLYKFSIDGSNGKITFMIPSSVTNGYDFDDAKYDFELQSDEDHYTQGGKYTIRLLYGNITILERHSKYSSALECS